MAKVINKNVSSIKNLKDDPSNSGGTIEGMIVGATTTVNGQDLTIDDENSNKATGTFAHAEGGSVYYFSDENMYVYDPTTASGDCSHAEGSKTTASGNYSHAEGNGTKALGNNSHAEGWNTIANHKSQHVIGEYNTADPSTEDTTRRGNYICIIGNGTSDNARSNALAIKWDGTFVFANGTEITPAQFASLLALLN